MRIRNFLAAASLSMAALGCAHAEGGQDIEQALAAMREGGNLIVMRHATSPSNQRAPIGMTEGCAPQKGRGLNAQGFAEARFIGEWLAANDIKIDKTYTSDMCRAWDTARLVAAGQPVEPRAELKADDPAVAENFRKELDAELRAAPAANILIVSHSNITPLYGAGPLPGEDETPSGRVHVVTSRGVVFRIDANAVVSATPALAR